LAAWTTIICYIFIQTQTVKSRDKTQEEKFHEPEALKKGGLSNKDPF